MENQIVIVVTEEQYHIIVNALNDLRTRCINENIDSTDVDYLLLDVIAIPPIVSPNLEAS